MLILCVGIFFYLLISLAEPESTSSQLPRNPIIESPSKLPTKKLCLFEDDVESDSNDIFSGHSTKASETPKQNKTKELIAQKPEPKASLFDDVSDDDNLFGAPAPSSDIAKKPTTKKTPAIQKSSSLFDDDSSGDDLFGAKPKGMEILDKNISL